MVLAWTSVSVFPDRLRLGVIWLYITVFLDIADQTKLRNLSENLHKDRIVLTTMILLIRNAHVCL